MDKEKIKRDFSRSAESYDRFARLQRRMGFELLGLISKGKKPQAILDLGCGTGWLAYKLAKKYPKARVVALDFALGMVSFARQHRQAPNLLYLCRDMEELRFKASSFDLAVSNASVQWTDLFRVSQRAKRVLKKGGRWVFTTFGPRTLWELKQAFLKEKKVSPVHDFLAPDGVKGILRRNGFKNIALKRKAIKQGYKNAQNLMQSLKGLGALSAKTPADTSLKRAKDLLAVMQRYDRRNNPFATYEILFCTAQK